MGRVGGGPPIIPVLTADPAGGDDGDLFYDSVLDKFRARRDGRWVTLGYAATIATLRRTTAQTIPSGGAGTAISFATVDQDAAGYYAAGAPTRLTVPAGYDGIHLAGGSFMWDANATGQRQWGMSLNGVAWPGSQDNRPGNAGFGVAASIVGPPRLLVAGDYVEIKAFQDSGADRSVLDSPNPNLWIVRLGPPA